MSEKKGNYSNDEIDDFAKALLDKKTEMQLYGDEDDDDELMFSNLNKRLNAANKTSDSVFIEADSQESSTRSNGKEVISILTEMSEDIPTIKVPSKTRPKKAAPEKKKAAAAAVPEKKTDGKQAVKKAPVKKAAGTKTNKILSEEARKKQRVKKKLWIAVAILVVITSAMLAGYAYKVVYWDPRNTVTESQEVSYGKLVAYADEYDMMSDTEKLELLDLESDYNSLLEKQKTAINSYFKEQTGKDFTALLQELKTLDQNNSDNNADYQALHTFFSGWDSYTDAQKESMVNYKDQYDALNQTLKNKIDALILQTTGSSFNSLYSQYTMQKPDHSEEIAQLQSQIDDLQSQVDDLNAYNTSLQEEMDSAVSQGLDASEYQSYIDQNNSTIEALKSQIAQLNTEIQNLS